MVDDSNPNVQVKIEEVTKERMEIRKVEPQPIVNIESVKLEQEFPYQRIYQNASKRFKKEECKDDSSSDEEDLDDNNQENVNMPEDNNEEKKDEPMPSDNQADLDKP